MVQGRKPDQARRRQASELRRQGLTLAEIGRRLGITHQGVQAVLRPPRRRVLAPRCPGCRGLLPEAGVSGPRDATALCLACLRQRPHTPFGLRLQTVRLAARLTLAELARRSGVSASSLRYYEGRQTLPPAAALVRLLGALGSDLVDERDRPGGSGRKRKGQG
jgi:transcriptional regulator with XRE-family HTH domain